MSAPAPAPFMASYQEFKAAAPKLFDVSPVLYASLWDVDPELVKALNAQVEKVATQAFAAGWNSGVFAMARGAKNAIEETHQ